jgi:hypothetical protein
VNGYNERNGKAYQLALSKINENIYVSGVNYRAKNLFPRSLKVDSFFYYTSQLNGTFRINYSSKQ